MNAAFQVGGCYTLEIGEDVVRDARDHASVGVQITYRGLPTPREDGLMDSVVEPKVVAAFHLKPSHARAVASALLSAATELR